MDFEIPVFETTLSTDAHTLEGSKAHCDSTKRLRSCSYAHRARQNSCSLLARALNVGARSPRLAHRERSLNLRRAYRRTCDTIDSTMVPLYVYKRNYVYA